MQNFHEDKLWQESYVALMDIHEALDGVQEGENEELVEDVVKSATDLAAKIADGLSRMDRRFAREILLDAVGLVAVVRTHLAVAWGRGLLEDAAFQGLDGKYARLSESLQGRK
jgi:four helix bundle protein